MVSNPLILLLQCFSTVARNVTSTDVVDLDSIDEFNSL